MSRDTPFEERAASYFYPPPDEHTLRNLAGIRGEKWLQVFD